MEGGSVRTRSSRRRHRRILETHPATKSEMISVPTVRFLMPSSAIVDATVAEGADEAKEALRTTVGEGGGTTGDKGQRPNGNTSSSPPSQQRRRKHSRNPLAKVNQHLRATDQFIGLAFSPGSHLTSQSASVFSPADFSVSAPRTGASDDPAAGATEPFGPTWGLIGKGMNKKVRTQEEEEVGEGVGQSEGETGKTYGSSLSPWTPTVPFSRSKLRSTEDRLSAMVLLLELMVWGWRGKVADRRSQELVQKQLQRRAKAETYLLERDEGVV